VAARPAFQHQGPDTNCVIDDARLGWLSCTAYAMAMLIDAATEGATRPKGCQVRRRVRPRDTEGGLTLGQVAVVAERDYDVAVSVRTGPRAIPVAKAARRIRNGRGFLLQGNNEAFGMHPVNHAIYVHEVRGGGAEMPAEALVYDPQRDHERWMPWATVVDFGARLRLNPSGTRMLGPRRMYAGFAPRRLTPVEVQVEPPTDAGDGVKLRFGAVRLRPRTRTRATPPPGRRVNVRSTPRSLTADAVIDLLEPGERFVAYQRVSDGAQPAGSGSQVWLGNKQGTEWVHVSGLRRVRRRP
jgi:hypothetical protein